MPTTPVKQARRDFNRTLDTRQEVGYYHPGLMGDGRGVVRVTGLQSHAWVRIGDEEAAAKVLNQKVPYINDLAVWVGIDPVDNIYQVLGVRSAPYLDSGQPYYPPVAEHHESHQFQSNGYDLVWADFEQITTLMLRAAPDLGAFWVRLSEGPMPRGTGWVWISAANGNTVTLNLAADQPGIGGLMALLYIDANGDLQRRLSAVVGVGILDITLTPAPNADEFPVAAVRLYAAQTQITDNYITRDIIQLRWPQYGTAGQSQDARNCRVLIEMRY